MKENQMRITESKCNKCEEPQKWESKAIMDGIGFGVVLAVTISWSVNKSILWACVHGSLSWIYVIYHAVTRH